MELHWKPIGTEEILDQEAELPGDYWAEIGPGFVDSDTDWSWTILTSSGDDDLDDPPVVVSGRAVSEKQAKRDVLAYLPTLLDQCAFDIDEDRFGPQD